jgi:SAM-dependent methyltransferase
MSADLKSLHLHPSLERIFARFPKVRPPLPEEYKEIYLQNFLAQRTGGSFLLKIVTRLEGWNHQQVVREGRPGGRILEIGAGTINHLPLEKDFESYDIVEPMEAAYQDSHNLDKVRAVYPDISAVPADEEYDRIFSVAVLEHVPDLPKAIALTGLHLIEGGQFQSTIPSEGGFAWGAAWRCTTSPSFKLRHGLDYKVIMRHDHLNTATEIEGAIRHFYKKFRMRRFPLPLKHLSFYTYLAGEEPDRQACEDYLAVVG